MSDESKKEHSEWSEDYLINLWSLPEELNADLQEVAKKHMRRMSGSMLHLGVFAPDSKRKLIEMQSRFIGYCNAIAAMQEPILHDNSFWQSMMVGIFSEYEKNGHLSKDQLKNIVDHIKV